MDLCIQSIKRLMELNHVTVETQNNTQAKQVTWQTFTKSHQSWGHSQTHGLCVFSHLSTVCAKHSSTFEKLNETTTKNKSSRSITELTFEFAEVERHFFDGKVDVKRCNLLSENEEMFYKKQLTIHRRLNHTHTDTHTQTWIRHKQWEINSMLWAGSSAWTIDINNIQHDTDTYKYPDRQTDRRTDGLS